MLSIKLRRSASGRRSKCRSGVECVELAISLPLLMIVMFSTIQICHVIHKEKLLRIACFEAMKAGASVHGDSEDAIRVFNTHASALGIRDAKLKIDPKAFDKARVGDPLFLEAIASVRSNQLPAPFNLSLSSSMSGGLIFYRKEGI